MHTHDIYTYRISHGTLNTNQVNMFIPISFKMYRIIHELCTFSFFFVFIFNRLRDMNEPRHMVLRHRIEWREREKLCNRNNVTHDAKNLLVCFFIAYQSLICLSAFVFHSFLLFFIAFNIHIFAHTIPDANNKRFFLILYFFTELDSKLQFFRTENHNTMFLS